MNGFRKLKRSFKLVFKDWRYSLLMVFVASVFYFLNVVFFNLSNLRGFYSDYGFVWILRFLVLGSLSFWNSVLPLTFFSILILSLLTGILVSLIVFRFRRIQQGGKKMGFFSSVGLFLGLLAPGCAACGVGLFAVLGLSGALLSLPFGGLEISVVAILILGIAVYFTGRDLLECGFIGRNKKIS